MLDPKDDNESRGSGSECCAEQDEPSPVKANRGYTASCYVDPMTGDLKG